MVVRVGLWGVKLEKGQFGVSNCTVPVIDVTIICYWLLSYFDY